MVPHESGIYHVVMNKSRQSIALFLLTAAFLALAATGCQTTKGFGKDVEKLGDKIQEKAK